MSHYFSEKQSGPYIIKEIIVSVAGITFSHLSSGGIFSKDHLDKGSSLLIESIEIPKDTTVLDIGCGNGIVGMAIKRLNPSVSVLMTDINERAVAIARKNISKSGFDNISAKKSNLYENIDKRFDIILSNPPQTAGKDVCFAIIEESVHHLNDGGTLFVVARHKKGGKILSEKMRETFGNLEEIAKKSGFRVYASQKLKSD